VKHSVAIIGVGNVGSEIAATLISKNLVGELILLDRDLERCAAQVQDLSDALGFSFTGKIIQGTYAEVKQADIVIIAAGRPQQKGESRLQLIEANKVILDDIMGNLKGIQQNAIVMIVANPLDVLTYCTLRELDLPRRQIFGTGTYLDSQRLKRLLSQKLSIGQDAITASVLGEHGDSQLVAWSATKIAGLPAEAFLSEHDKKELEQQVREVAYEIIQGKGSTSYGIAACVASLCQIILYNRREIVPVSWYQAGFGCCMSLLAVLSDQGIERVLPIELTADELSLLNKSASVLKDYQKMVD
jgi:L-lactate dehydrogenase